MINLFRRVLKINTEKSAQAISYPLYQEEEGVCHQKTQPSLRVQRSSFLEPLFKIGVAVFLLTTLLSCDEHKVYEEYKEIAGANWQKENIINFEFEANDTSSAHNLYINIRNTGYYPYSNIYLFVTMKGPNGNLLKDTVNCILADNRGKWLGKGIGDLWDLQMPYFGGFKFAQKGKYIVSYEQATRVENGLKGVTDVGLMVEKTKN